MSQCLYIFVSPAKSSVCISSTTTVLTSTINVGGWLLIGTSVDYSLLGFFFADQIHCNVSVGHCSHGAFKKKKRVAKVLYIQVNTEKSVQVQDKERKIDKKAHNKSQK